MGSLFGKLAGLLGEGNVIELSGNELFGKSSSPEPSPQKLLSVADGAVAEGGLPPAAIAPCSNVPMRTGPLAVAGGAGDGRTPPPAFLPILALPSTGRQTAVLDFRRPETAMETLTLAPELALEPEEKARVDEIRHWLQLVWDAWQRMTYAEAIAHVRAARPDDFPIISVGGHGGGDLRNAKTTEAWFAKLGKKQGRPDWNNYLVLARGSAIRGPRGQRDFDPLFMQELMQLCLHPNHPRLETCYRKLARRWTEEGMGLTMPSLQQAKTWKQQRVPKTLWDKVRGGSGNYNDTVRGWIRRRCNCLPGQIWFCDHRQMDFWLKFPDPANPGKFIAVRPYITMIQDAASGFIVKAIIYADQYPNHMRILECIQEAIRAAGFVPPQIWYTDNGKDFLKIGVVTPVKLRVKNQAGMVLADADGNPYEHSVVLQLRAIHKAARGYNGKEKPVERKFRDVADDFDRTQVGYCGNCPANRPDYGETWEGDVNRLPSEYQVLEQFNDWLTNEFHVRGEGGDKYSPREMWEARVETRRPLTEAELFFAMLMPHSICPLVSRTPLGGGVVFHGWTYSHVDLKPYWGKPVMVKTYWGVPDKVEWLPRHKEPRRFPYGIFMFEPSGKFICAAAADQLGDMHAVTEQQKEQIGLLSHIINYAASLDGKEKFKELTGKEKITDPNVVLRGLPGHGPESTAIAATPGGRRRIGGVSTDAVGLTADGGRRAAGAAPTRELSAEERAAMLAADAVLNALRPVDPDDNPGETVDPEILDRVLAQRSNHQEDNA